MAASSSDVKDMPTSIPTKQFLNQVARLSPNSIFKKLISTLPLATKEKTLATDLTYSEVMELERRALLEYKSLLVGKNPQELNILGAIIVELDKAKAILGKNFQPKAMFKAIEVGKKVEKKNEFQERRKDDIRGSFGATKELPDIEYIYKNLLREHNSFNKYNGGDYFVEKWFDNKEAREEEEYSLILRSGLQSHPVARLHIVNILQVKDLKVFIEHSQGSFGVELDDCQLNQTHMSVYKRLRFMLDMAFAYKSFLDADFGLAQTSQYGMWMPMLPVSDLNRMMLTSDFEEFEMKDLRGDVFFRLYETGQFTPVSAEGIKSFCEGAPHKVPPELKSATTFSETTKNLYDKDYPKFKQEIENYCSYLFGIVAYQIWTETNFSWDARYPYDLKDIKKIVVDKSEPTHDSWATAIYRNQWLASPREILDMVHLCWSKHPAQRPSMDTIICILERACLMTKELHDVCLSVLRTHANYDPKLRSAEGLDSGSLLFSPAATPAPTVTQAPAAAMQPGSKVNELSEPGAPGSDAVESSEPGAQQPEARRQEAERQEAERQRIKDKWDRGLPSDNPEVNKVKDKLEKMKTNELVTVTIADKRYLIKMLSDGTVMHIRDEKAFFQSLENGISRDKNSRRMYEQNDFIKMLLGGYSRQVDTSRNPIDAPTKFWEGSDRQASGRDLVELQRTQAVPPSTRKP